MKTSNKINTLISSREKNKGLLLSFLLLIGMVFEVLGIGVLLPILTAVLNPEVLFENEITKSILETLEIKDKDLIVKVSLGSLMLVYFLKSIYLVFLSFYQNRFTSNLTSNLSNKLFDKYLKQSYSFHINRNSSTLIKNIQIELNNFSNYLISIISLITESTLAFSVVITLFFLEPLATILVLLLFGIAALFFYQITRRVTTRWGQMREKIDSKTSKIVVEGLSGIKEVILLRKQSFFQNQLEKNNSKKAIITSKVLTLRQTPRYFLELLSVFSLIVFVFLMLIQNKDIESVIVTLGVFVAATFRILPSINRILSSLQNIKYYQSSIDVLYEELKSTNDFDYFHNNSNDRLILNKLIEIQNLYFSYPGTELSILNNVSLKIKTGSTIGIIGESGSGKSTLVNILVGLLKPSSGKILIDNNLDIYDDLDLWKNSIGYVSQDVYLSDNSILMNIAFGVEKESIDLELIDKVIEQSKLAELIERLPKGYDTNVGERGVQLSGGQRQRIGIARALYRKPNILVLDEATSSLDVKTEENIMRSVDNLKGQMTIIIVTHRLVTLKNCDEIFSIKRGKLSKENNIKIN
ncbi:ABC transporter ATP-binding protein [Candidatus Arcticimaribacter forsetii]|uniref:ABC transporter ATP-binding protein n=1 Tax=Candidatus Arcticimaribacter forsetii TaxID=2820661 RepID=UPI002076DF68|nr:ABC transporter ATP-binding protein [Candidatus Arcticimaribacter forsetii]MDB4674036.1 ABC transporter ATP-binding protein/permease [Flavobacteriaceae bacterium]